MASVTSVPGWIGSSAKSVTGESSMAEAMKALKVSVPGYMSQIAGKSTIAEYVLSTNNKFNNQDIVDLLLANGEEPVVITVSGYIESSDYKKPTLYFPASLKNQYVDLIINGSVNGGFYEDYSYEQKYGVAIQNMIGQRLRIANNGTIASGNFIGKAVAGTSPMWVAKGTIYGSVA